jgi:hypothetical protein
MDFCPNILGAGARKSRHFEGHVSAIMPEPYLAVLDEREYVVVLDGILIAYDQELFIKRNELGKVLAEQGKRRVCDHDVGLLEQFYAFQAAEIAVTPEDV